MFDAGFACFALVWGSFVSDERFGVALVHGEPGCLVGVWCGGDGSDFEVGVGDYVLGYCWFHSSVKVWIVLLMLSAIRTTGHKSMVRKKIKTLR